MMTTLIQAGVSALYGLIELSEDYSDKDGIRKRMLNTP